MKKKSSSHILFVIGCVLCGVAAVMFVISSFLLFFKTDGTNMISDAFNAFGEAVASLFGSGAKSGSYTYGLMGLGVVTVVVTIYFAIIFLKVKKYKSFVAALVNLVNMAMLVLLAEAAILAIVRGTGTIRLRGFGALLLTLLPVVLSFLSLVILQVVSFADQASQNREDIECLQIQIDDLRRELEAHKAEQPVAAPAEEVKEEEPAPAVEEKAEEPAAEPAPIVAAVAEETEDKDSETIVDAETGLTYIVRYNKSFKAKITLAKPEVQDWYNEVKNYILSFGANTRMSWNYDSFNVGRKQVAKLNITGKTLSIYVALDPSEYVDSKYHAKDVSESKKYEQTPTQMKIKSDRGVKFAKELIDVVMAQLGLTSNGEVAGDFHEEKRTFEELLADELIKESKSLVKEAPVAAPAAEEAAPAAPVAAEPAPADEVAEEGEEVTDVESVEEPDEVESEEEAAEEEKDGSKNEKTIYHVSKRENDGREWKVFKQGSKKVIKLFPTQKEAFDYAKQLAKNKGDGSYVLLHGLDGKIRKY